MNSISNKVESTIEYTVDYLVASDFDQTLSFNDSGAVLAEMMGVANY